MNRQSPSSTPRLRVFTTVFVGLGVLPPTAVAQDPGVIHVPGIIRDFPQSHRDFDVTPSAGPGHYAGNHSLLLGGDLKPEFTGAGYLVTSQWRNKHGQPIAPHLYDVGENTVEVVSSPSVAGNPTVDTYNSDVGPYGGSNRGEDPEFVEGSTMPTIVEPTDMPPLEDTLEFASNGQLVLGRDVHCNDFIVRNRHQLVIDGHVRILCESLFSIENRAAIIIPEGSSLTMYIKGDVVIENNTDLNNTADSVPGRFVMYVLSSGDVVIENFVQMQAVLVAPNATLNVRNNGDFYGSFTGQSVQMENNSGFHLDVPTPRDTCDETIVDMRGTAGAPSAGAITSTATFDQWFEDHLGTNLSQLYVLAMVRNTNGIYEFQTPLFHPIDDRLLGNEGMAHNYFFTYEFGADFVYDACVNQFFEFSGSDDAWIFVDENMVIDLGGISPSVPQVVRLDRLDLVDGETYTMRFFYAQRQGEDAEFNLRTNTVLLPPPLVATGTGGYD